jgi:hypothetical protein
MTTYKVRKNASQKNIDKTIAQIKADWKEQDKNSPVLFYEGDYAVLDRPGTFYLSIGGVVRYGYRNGVEAWGFDENHVDRELAGQFEYLDLLDRQYA